MLGKLLVCIKIREKRRMTHSVVFRKYTKGGKANVSM